MSMSQAQKAEAFAALHHRKEAFVIANAFDGCSVCVLASLEFEALATSSWVQAATLGQRDVRTTRQSALAHAKQIADATHLPVSADLGNGFGPAPDDAATTIREAALAGLVGGSIEDATGDRAAPVDVNAILRGKA